MEMLKTKEIKQKSGVALDTLNDHVARGRLPKPEFISLGRGGGSLYWPKSVLAQLELIKTLKKAGYRSHQIDTILKEKSTT